MGREGWQGEEVLLELVPSRTGLVLSEPGRRVEPAPPSQYLDGGHLYPGGEGERWHS